MADLTIVPGNVAFVSGTVFTKDAGVTIVAGRLLYPDTGDKWQLVNNSMNVAPYMALNDGVAGQPITAISRGVVNIGVTMTQGLPLFISPNDGLISDDIADVLSTMYVSIVGYPASAMNYLTVAPYLIPHPLT